MLSPAKSTSDDDFHLYYLYGIQKGMQYVDKEYERRLYES